jgi:hypothetical protein
MTPTTSILLRVGLHGEDFGDLPTSEKEGWLGRLFLGMSSFRGRIRRGRRYRCVFWGTKARTGIMRARKMLDVGKEFGCQYQAGQSLPFRPLHA